MKKTPHRPTQIVIAAAFLFSFFVRAGCSKDDDVVDHTYTISGTASGAQEVPAVTTSATGSLTGEYNDETNILTYSITWTGLSGVVNAAHFHGPALAGVNAVPIVTFTIANNAASGNLSGTASLSEAQEADLLAGKWYYNLHTTANGGGEIRGQVSAVK